MSDPTLAVDEPTPVDTSAADPTGPDVSQDPNWIPEDHSDVDGAVS